MIEITRPNMLLIRGDAVISSHRSEVEAMERASKEGAGEFTLVRPDATINVSDIEPIQEPTEPVTDPSVPIPPPEPASGVPLIPHDKDSAAWQRFLDNMDTRGGGARYHALLWVVTGNEQYRITAIEKAQSIVDNSNPESGQFLRADSLYADVFTTYSWCGISDDIKTQWSAWGRKHLGNPDGSEWGTMWWSNRWSRNNPANNYYHSFMMSTSMYSMATGDQEYIDFLKNDRIPLMSSYYARTPEGGSREGTSYGVSHKTVFKLAKMWRDFDGTEIVPQTFIDNSILYWTHATMPGGRMYALIGDQPRSHGIADGYYREIIGNALLLTDNPESVAIGNWQLNTLSEISSHVFIPNELFDYPDTGHPPESLVYHAKGAGHFFARDSWGSDATMIGFTAGRYDEAHQHHDQGAFFVWANSKWQTVDDANWSHGGVDKLKQNALGFPDIGNIKFTTSTLEWSKVGNLIKVDMTLTPAVGQLWLRSAEWEIGSNSLLIRDYANPDVAVFHFEQPSQDDERVTVGSSASVITDILSDGFMSVVSW